MTLKDAFNYCVYFLSANGVDEAEFKALCIVCSIAGIKNSEYEAHREDTVMLKPVADALWRLKSGFAAGTAFAMLMPIQPLPAQRS